MKTNEQKLAECLEHIKTLGNIIRALDEDDNYNEYWLHDGGYTMFTNEIEGVYDKENWRKLWDQFGDTPVNEEDEIDEPFLHFPSGTDKMDIWHWFEDKFDITLGEELYKKGTK